MANNKDDGFDGFDDDFDINFDDDFGIETDDMYDNSEKSDIRKPTESKLKEGSKEFTKAFDLRNDPRQVRELMVKSLPEELEVHFDNATELYDEVENKVDAALPSIKNSVLDMADAASYIVPENGPINDFLNKVKEWSRGESDYYESDEERENEDIKYELDALLGERQSSENRLELAQTEMGNRLQLTSNEMMAEVAVNTSALNSFNRQITEGYYRRSLELTYKLLNVGRKHLSATKVGTETLIKLLGDIVHNTNLPDILKARTTEAIKAAAIQKVGGEGANRLFTSLGGTNLVDRLARKFEDVLNTGVDHLEQVASASTMIDENTGSSLQAHTLIASTAAGRLKSLGTAKLREQLSKTKRGQKIILESQRANMDLAEYLQSKKMEEDKSWKKIVNSLLDFSSSIVKEDSVEATISVSTEEGTTPVSLDRLMHDTVTRSIPTLLSEILTSVRSIETGERQPTTYYDLDSSTIKSRNGISNDFKQNIERKMDEESYVYQTHLNDNLANNMGEKTFAKFMKRVGEFSFEGKSFSPNELEANGFMDGMTPKERTAIKKAISKATKSKIIGGQGVKEHELFSSMKGIKDSIPDPTTFLQDAIANGTVTELVDDGIVDYDTDTKRYTIDRKKYMNLISNHISKSDLYTANKRSASKFQKNGSRNERIIREHNKHLDEMDVKLKRKGGMSGLDRDKFSIDNEIIMAEWDNIKLRLRQLIMIVKRDGITDYVKNESPKVVNDAFKLIRKYDGTEVSGNIEKEFTYYYNDLKKVMVNTETKLDDIAEENLKYTVEEDDDYIRLSKKLKSLQDEFKESEDYEKREDLEKQITNQETLLKQREEKIRVTELDKIFEETIVESYIKDVERIKLEILPITERREKIKQWAKKFTNEIHFFIHEEEIYNEVIKPELDDLEIKMKAKEERNDRVQFNHSRWTTKKHINQVIEDVRNDKDIYEMEAKLKLKDGNVSFDDKLKLINDDGDNIDRIIKNSEDKAEITAFSQYMLENDKQLKKLNTKAKKRFINPKRLEEITKEIDKRTEELENQGKAIGYINLLANKFKKIILKTLGDDTLEPIEQLQDATKLLAEARVLFLDKMPNGKTEKKYGKTIDVKPHHEVYVKVYRKVLKPLEKHIPMHFANRIKEASREIRNESRNNSIFQRMFGSPEEAVEEIGEENQTPTHELEEQERLSREDAETQEREATIRTRTIEEEGLQLSISLLSETEKIGLTLLRMEEHLSRSASGFEAIVGNAPIEKTHVRTDEELIIKTKRVNPRELFENSTPAERNALEDGSESGIFMLSEFEGQSKPFDITKVNETTRSESTVSMNPIARIIGGLFGGINPSSSVDNSKRRLTAPTSYNLKDIDAKIKTTEIFTERNKTLIEVVDEGFKTLDETIRECCDRINGIDEPEEETEELEEGDEESTEEEETEELEEGNEIPISSRVSPEPTFQLEEQPTIMPLGNMASYEMETVTPVLPKLEKPTVIFHTDNIEVTTRTIGFKHPRKSNNIDVEDIILDGKTLNDLPTSTSIISELVNIEAGVVNINNATIDEIDTRGASDIVYDNREENNKNVIVTNHTNNITSRVDESKQVNVYKTKNLPTIATPILETEVVESNQMIETSRPIIMLPEDNEPPLEENSAIRNIIEYLATIAKDASEKIESREMAEKRDRKGGWRSRLTTDTETVETKEINVTVEREKTSFLGSAIGIMGNILSTPLGKLATTVGLLGMGLGAINNPDGLIARGFRYVGNAILDSTTSTVKSLWDSSGWLGKTIMGGVGLMLAKPLLLGIKNIIFGSRDTTNAIDDMSKKNTNNLKMLERSIRKGLRELRNSSGSSDNEFDFDMDDEEDKCKGKQGRALRTCRQREKRKERARKLRTSRSKPTTKKSLYKKVGSWFSGAGESISNTVKKYGRKGLNVTKRYGVKASPFIMKYAKRAALIAKKIPGMSIATNLAQAGYDVSKGKYKDAIISVTQALIANVPVAGTAGAMLLDTMRSDNKQKTISQKTTRSTVKSTSGSINNSKLEPSKETSVRNDSRIVRRNQEKAEIQEAKKKARLERRLNNTSELKTTRPMESVKTNNDTIKDIRTIEPSKETSVRNDSRIVRRNQEKAEIQEAKKKARLERKEETNVDEVTPLSKKLLIGGGLMAVGATTMMADNVVDNINSKSTEEFIKVSEPSLEVVKDVEIPKETTEAIKIEPVENVLVNHIIPPEETSTHISNTMNPTPILSSGISLENIRVNLNVGQNLTEDEKARIIRLIENNGKYEGGSKYSSAWGAYMFVRDTRKEIFKKAGLKDSDGTPLNEDNWKTHSNQDQMFRWYMNRIRKALSKVIPYSGLLVDYLGWQSGISGFKRMYKSIIGERKLFKSYYKKIDINVPEKTKETLHKYLAIKFKQVSNYPIKDSLSYPEFLTLLTTHVPDKLENILLEVSVTYSNVWGKHFENKILNYMKKIGREEKTTETTRVEIEPKSYGDDTNVHDSNSTSNNRMNDFMVGSTNISESKTGDTNKNDIGDSETFIDNSLEKARKESSLKTNLPSDKDIDEIDVNTASSLSGNTEAGRGLDGLTNGETGEKVDYNTKLTQIKNSLPWLYSNIGKPYSMKSVVNTYSMSYDYPTYDCSSLVASFLGRRGIGLNENHTGTIHRTAESQFLSKHFDHFMDEEKAQPGDLVWFKAPTSNPERKHLKANHVAIYVGDGWIVHAKGGGAHKVVLTPIWIGKYKDWFIGFGRYNGKESLNTIDAKATHRDGSKANKETMSAKGVADIGDMEVTTTKASNKLDITSDGKSSSAGGGWIDELMKNVEEKGLTGAALDLYNKSDSMFDGTDIINKVTNGTLRAIDTVDRYGRDLYKKGSNIGSSEIYQDITNSETFRNSEKVVEAISSDGFIERVNGKIEDSLTNNHITETAEEFSSDVMKGRNETIKKYIYDPDQEFGADVVEIVSNVGDKISKVGSLVGNGISMTTEQVERMATKGAKSLIENGRKLQKTIGFGDMSIGYDEIEALNDIKYHPERKNRISGVYYGGEISTSIDDGKVIHNNLESDDTMVDTEHLYGTGVDKDVRAKALRNLDFYKSGSIDIGRETIYNDMKMETKPNLITENRRIMEGLFGNGSNEKIDNFLHLDERNKRLDEYITLERLSKTSATEEPITIWDRDSKLKENNGINKILGIDEVEVKTESEVKRTLGDVETEIQTNVNDEPSVLTDITGTVKEPVVNVNVDIPKTDSDNLLRAMGKLMSENNRLQKDLINAVRGIKVNDKPEEITEVVQETKDNELPPYDPRKDNRFDKGNLFDVARDVF